MALLLARGERPILAPTRQAGGEALRGALLDAASIQRAALRIDRFPEMGADPYRPPPPSSGREICIVSLDFPPRPSISILHLAIR